MNAKDAGAEVGARQETQPELLSMAESLSSLIALIQDNRLIYVNPAGAAILGRPRDFLVGRHFCEIVHPEDREASIARANARVAGIATPKRLIERLMHADGRTIWMECSVDLITFRGRPTTLVSASDVTERLRMEEELRLSESRLAEAQRIGHIGSWEWHVADDRLCWSDEMCRLYGVEPSQFGATLRGYFDLVHPEDRDTARAALDRALRAGGSFAFEHRVIHPNGDVRAIYGRGQVFLDDFGTPVRAAGTAQDITERRRMEEDIRRSEERFRAAFNHAAIGKAVVSPDGHLLQVNPMACQALGYTETEFLGLSSDDVTHPDDRAKTKEFLGSLLRGDRVSGSLEKRFVAKDGRTIWGNVTTTLVRDKAGTPLYFITEVEDITERKKTETALRESEERFRNLCVQAPVMLMSFAPDGTVRDVSNYWLQTMGYAREDIVGRDGWRLITPESQERLREAIAANERNRETVIRNIALRGIRKDGSTLDILSTSVAQLDDDGRPTGAICVSINVSELQRAEEALRESEERYRALVEHAPEAIMVLDVETDRFVDVNAHAEKLFGFSREKLLTMGPLDFCPDRQADGRESSDVEECEIKKVLAGETTTFEFTHVTADGREVQCQTRLSRLPAAGRQLVRVTVTDITELKQLQVKIRETEKLAAIGVLAAGVAHEIGNPLMALSMAAESLERKTCNEYTQGKLGLIREHIDRISRIVRQMSDLARPQSGQKAKCDLNTIVRRAVDIVRYDKRSGSCEIVYELAEHLPNAEVVEDELMQVCINLALNAFDSMAANPPERARRLTVRSAATDAALTVSFHDTGAGVPEEIRPKLFQPFFTTKEAGRGSGLGLSVSYRIMQEHGGTLRLGDDGTPGAVFVFEIPRTVRR